MTVCRDDRRVVEDNNIDNRVPLCLFSVKFHQHGMLFCIDDRAFTATSLSVEGPGDLVAAALEIRN